MATTTVNEKVTVVDTISGACVTKPDPKADMKQHARKEHLGGAAAVLGTAFALYEKHKAKSDPENGHRHRVGEAIAGAVAIGSGAYALHERRDKKQAEKIVKLLYT